jgi:hypothetical protein
MTDVKRGEIDGDGLRQIFRQTRDESSVTTWLAIAPDTFTAGEFSPLAKCSGTFMWILRFSSMRWKSTCRISFLNGYLHVAQQDLRHGAGGSC